MKKKILPVLCGVLLTALIASCSSSASGAAQSYTPGTYTGTATGYGGPIEVAVTVDTGKILNIEVKKSNESPGIGTVAVAELPGIITESQSLGVDSIGAATFSSAAIFQAVGDALVKAGGDLVSLSAKPAKPAAPAKVINLSADVVVVGAGAAGMSASITLAEAGKKVITLEKMAMCGGALSIAGGALQSAGSAMQKEKDPTDSVEAIYQDLWAAGHQKNVPSLLRQWVNGGGETFDLVTGWGTQWTGPVTYAEHRFVKRVYNAVGGGGGISAAMVNKMSQTSTELMLNTRAYELVLSNGAVTGVKARNTRTGQEYVVSGKKVILTAGGFGNEKSMLSEAMSTAVFYGHASSQGDGHKMVQAAGGKLRDLDFGRIYPNGIETSRSKGIATPNQGGDGTILVDKNGRRITDETGLMDTIRNLINEQPDKKLYTVMGAAEFDKFRAGIRLYQGLIDTWLEQNGSGTPIFAHGATLKEAGDKAGINGDNLTATVARYNSFVQGGKDLDFNRAVKAPVGAGPYYVVEQKRRFATTLGGVVVNDSFQVLNAGDQPIGNLYSAGEMVPGGHGNDAIVGSAISWAITSGRLAARSVMGSLN